MRSRWLWLIVGAVIVLAAVAALAVVHERRAAHTRAEQVQTGLAVVGRAIYNRCQVEGLFTLPPSASEVNPEALSTYLPSGHPWPTNPYTGEPMHLGSGPGDIRYSTGRESGNPCFILDSRGTWGQKVPGLLWLLPHPGDKVRAPDGPAPAVSASPLPGAEVQ